MQANPRRVADQEVEAAGARRIRELRRKRERRARCPPAPTLRRERNSRAVTRSCRASSRSSRAHRDVRQRGRARGQRPDQRHVVAQRPAPAGRRTRPPGQRAPAGRAHARGTACECRWRVHNELAAAWRRAGGPVPTRRSAKSRHRSACRRTGCCGRGSATEAPPTGPSPGGRCTSDSHRRSSQSQTAVGFTSTPKTDCESNLTPDRAQRPAHRLPTMRSCVRRSTRCTRKAPEPHAGSSTRSPLRASRSVVRFGRLAAPRDQRFVPACPRRRHAQTECVERAVGHPRHERKRRVERARRPSVAEAMSDSNARPRISGSIAASLTRSTISSRAVKR